MTAILLGGAVLVRLILCLQVAATPLARIHEFFWDSDNEFFDRWGRRIADGDWLQREPLHPTTDWMRFVAAKAMSMDPGLPFRLGVQAGGAYDRAEIEKRLWDRWLGNATFYQEPAYPYLVGLTYRVTGPKAWHVYAWQLALGALGVLLVHRLARRLFSETAALAAGALAVLAPIPLLFEVTLLRDSLVAFLTVALALLMHRAPEGGRSRWLGLGLAFGAASLVKQSFLFFPVLMATWRLAAVRAPWRDRFAAGGWVAAGMGIALLPAILRNVAVGAPALALNGSASSMLAMFHCVGASPLDSTVPPDFARVAMASDGSLLTALVEAAKTHPDALSFIALEAKKLAYAWHGFESPNNVDFYLFRQGAPVLAFLPAVFVVLLPLACVGVATRRALDAWPVFVAILATLPTLILAAALSRYRAALAFAIVPLAGAGVVRLWEWIAGGRWLRTAAAVGLTALYVAWATGDPLDRDPPSRALRYARIGAGWTERGEPAYGALALRESLRLVPNDPEVEALLGKALYAAGDAKGALPRVEAAARRGFDSPSLRELHAQVLATLGRRDEAMAKARSALEAEPGNVVARQLLLRLQQAAPPPETARRTP